MASALWFLLHDDREVGPVSVRVLRRLAASGELDPTSLVRREGEFEWIPAGRVPGVFTEQESEGAMSAGQSALDFAFDSAVTRMAAAPLPSEEHREQRSLRHAARSGLWLVRYAGCVADRALDWVRTHRRAAALFTLGVIGSILALALLTAGLVCL